MKHRPRCAVVEGIEGPGGNPDRETDVSPKSSRGSGFNKVSVTYSSCYQTAGRWSRLNAQLKVLENMKSPCRSGVLCTNFLLSTPKIAKNLLAYQYNQLPKQ